MVDTNRLASRLAARLLEGREEPAARLIADDVWLAVVEGTVLIGERLPTARQLAVELGVSPRTVERAYHELEERGVVASRAGEGTFISLKPPPEAERERHHRFAELCREAYSGAATLGFTIDDLMGALAEFRSLEQPNPAREGGR